MLLGIKIIFLDMLPLCGLFVKIDWATKDWLSLRELFKKIGDAVLESYLISRTHVFWFLVLLFYLVLLEKDWNSSEWQEEVTWFILSLAAAFCCLNQIRKCALGEMVLFIGRKGLSEFLETRLPVLEYYWFSIQQQIQLCFCTERISYRKSIGNWVWIGNFPKSILMNK